jgi:hypothetical protein
MCGRMFRLRSSGRAVNFPLNSRRFAAKLLIRFCSGGLEPRERRRRTAGARGVPLPK